MLFSGKGGLFLNRISLFLFGHGVTPSMEVFSRQLSWSFFGGAIASAILLAVNILAGRFLGPEEYGKFNVIWAIAQVLIVFLCFGMDYSGTNFISRERSLSKKIVSASSYFFLFVVFVVSAVFVLFIDDISSLLAFDWRGLMAALFLGIVFSLKQILDAYIKGLEKFKLQSFAKVMESLIVLCMFLLLYENFGSQYTAYVFSLMIGAMTVAALYFTFLKGFFCSLDIKVLKSMLSYGQLMFLASILGILFQSADKILINKYLSPSDVGVYSAYYMATIALVSQAAMLFNNVFYPMVSRSRDSIDIILKKLDRVSIILFVPGIIFVGMILLVILNFYGSAYPIDWYLIVGFSTLSAVQAIVAVNVSVVIAHSEYAIKIGIIYGNMVSLSVIGAYFFLISNGFFSMYSLVVLLGVYYLLTLVAQKYVQFKLRLYQQL